MWVLRLWIDSLPLAVIILFNDGLIVMECWFVPYRAFIEKAHLLSALPTIQFDLFALHTLKTIALLACPIVGDVALFLKGTDELFVFFPDSTTAAERLLQNTEVSLLLHDLCMTFALF